MEHEDSIVMAAVTMSSEQPFKRWSDLAAQQLPGWVGKQIRNRWVNQLDPNSNHLPFSCEDNLLLWEAHKKLGTKWAEISTKLFHSIQPENQIKKCWYSASFKNLYPTNLARPLMSSDWYWWWWPSKQEAKIYLQRCNSYNQRPNPMSLLLKRRDSVLCIQTRSRQFASLWRVLSH